MPERFRRLVIRDRSPASPTPIATSTTTGWRGRSATPCPTPIGSRACGPFRRSPRHGTARHGDVSAAPHASDPDRRETGPYRSLSIILQVTPSAGAWLQVMPCPTTEGLIAFRAARKANGAEGGARERCPAAQKRPLRGEISALVNCREEDDAISTIRRRVVTLCTSATRVWRRWPRGGLDGGPRGPTLPGRRDYTTGAPHPPLRRRP